MYATQFVEDDVFDGSEAGPQAPIETGRLRLFSVRPQAGSSPACLIDSGKVMNLAFEERVIGRLESEINLQLRWLVSKTQATEADLQDEALNRVIDKRVSIEKGRDAGELFDTLLKVSRNHLRVHYEANPSRCKVSLAGKVNPTYIVSALHFSPLGKDANGRERLSVPSADKGALQKMLPNEVNELYPGDFVTILGLYLQFEVHKEDTGAAAAGYTDQHGATQMAGHAGEGDSDGIDGEEDAGAGGARAAPAGPQSARASGRRLSHLPLVPLRQGSETGASAAGSAPASRAASAAGGGSALSSSSSACGALSPPLGGPCAPTQPVGLLNPSPANAPTQAVGNLLPSQNVLSTQAVGTLLPSQNVLPTQLVAPGSGSSTGASQHRASGTGSFAPPPHMTLAPASAALGPAGSSEPGYRGGSGDSGAHEYEDIMQANTLAPLHDEDDEGEEGDDEEEGEGGDDMGAEAVVQALRTSGPRGSLSERAQSAATRVGTGGTGTIDAGDADEEGEEAQGLPTQVRPSQGAYKAALSSSAASAAPESMIAGGATAAAEGVHVAHIGGDDDDGDYAGDEIDDDLDRIGMAHPDASGMASLHGSPASLVDASGGGGGGGHPLSVRFASTSGVSMSAPPSEDEDEEEADGTGASSFGRVGRVPTGMPPRPLSATVAASATLVQDEPMDEDEDGDDDDIVVPGRHTAVKHSSIPVPESPPRKAGGRRAGPRLVPLSPDAARAREEELAAGRGDGVPASLTEAYELPYTAIQEDEDEEGGRYEEFAGSLPAVSLPVTGTQPATQAIQYSGHTQQATQALTMQQEEEDEEEEEEEDEKDEAGLASADDAPGELRVAVDEEDSSNDIDGAMPPPAAKSAAKRRSSQQKPAAVPEPERERERRSQPKARGSRRKSAAGSQSAASQTVASQAAAPVPAPVTSRRSRASTSSAASAAAAPQPTDSSVGAMAAMLAAAVEADSQVMRLSPSATAPSSSLASQAQVAVLQPVAQLEAAPEASDAPPASSKGAAVRGKKRFAPAHAPSADDDEAATTVPAAAAAAADEAPAPEEEDAAASSARGAKRARRGNVASSAGSAPAAAAASEPAPEPGVAPAPVPARGKRGAAAKAAAAAAPAEEPAAPAPIAPAAATTRKRARAAAAEPEEEPDDESRAVAGGESDDGAPVSKRPAAGKRAAAGRGKKAAAAAAATEAASEEEEEGEAAAAAPAPKRARKRAAAASSGSGGDDTDGHSVELPRPKGRAKRGVQSASSAAPSPAPEPAPRSARKAAAPASSAKAKASGSAEVEPAASASSPSASSSSSAAAAAAAPSSRVAPRRVRVILTAFTVDGKAEEARAIVKQLGGEVLDIPAKDKQNAARNEAAVGAATHVVTFDVFPRTPPMLLAAGRGGSPHIVTAKWLEDSARQGGFVDLSTDTAIAQYAPSTVDPDRNRPQELKHLLGEPTARPLLVQRARPGFVPALTGHSVWFLPGYDELTQRLYEAVARSAGATVLTRAPSDAELKAAAQRTTRSACPLLVIGDKGVHSGARPEVKRVRDAGLPVYNKFAIQYSVLAGGVNLARSVVGTDLESQLL